jgi:hypothetical protein
MKATCWSCGEAIDLEDGNGVRSANGWAHEECHEAEEENAENEADSRD